ncbi:MAG TPA: CotH kinase family protein [Anaeromyxobacter sp.]|nr:CotH kinase family protein [Anaeromyxobacter sp.]
MAILAALAGAACGGDRAPAPQPRCGLAVAGPVWTVEGVPVRVPIACADGASLPDLTVRGLPQGARWDPADAAVTWTPALSDAGVYDLVASLPTGETATGRVGVADAWDAPGNAPPEPARYTEEYGLPVVHLAYQGRLGDARETPATLTYRGRTHAVSLKYRGSRSLEFPKKSFSVKLADGTLFSDPALGIVERKRFVLVTTFDDQTHVRDRLALALWKRLAPGRFGVNTGSAVVYLNGAFQGLYVLSEKLGGQVLSSAGLNGDGNLYQAKSHAANFDATLPDGAPKATWHDGYEKDEGLPPQGEPGAFDDLDAFVAFVAGADDGRFAAELPGLADVDEYRDWWVLVMLASSADCAAKNGILFHDPRGGAWRASAWDWGASLGQDWQTSRTSAWDGYEFAAPNRLFRRLLAPPFGDATRARLGAAVRERVPVADVLALYDAMVAETAAVARRDEARWGDAQRAFFGAEGRADWGGGEAEVAYVRRWIQDRWTFLSRRY